MLLDKVDSLDDKNGESRFRLIDGNYGPLKKGDLEYKGSSWNVKVNWENGSSTYEPLHFFAKCDPVICSLYASKNNLLDTPGWKQFKNLAKAQRKLLCMENQDKLKCFRSQSTYSLGVRVPRNHMEAKEIDQINKDSKWQQAEQLDIKKIDRNQVLEDLGIDRVVPEGFKMITVRFVYSVKHDVHYKARLVAGGHLTKPLFIASHRMN